MRKLYIPLISFVILVIFFSSCASRKDLVYFQPDSTLLHETYELNAPKLQPGDQLVIMISADDIRATEAFNQASIYQSRNSNDAAFRPTYAIDVDGNIDYPKLGKVKLAGLTRTDAIGKMRAELSRFIQDPGVNINITNFRVTVLGEVKSPGSYLVQSDRITLLEAIGMAGDLTINGVRKDVLVIREQNGKKEEFRVDLTKRDALNSPVYYLAQNDIIYIEPNGARIQSSKYTQNNSLFISIAGIIITVISVITR
ncbi:polysaccharide biosynthesis/export family protein [Sphingobacterium hungaricum]|uniref:Sugar transporter n=1 Tax=Sphingobacterium hungaricum TaxID=2082723 RepID=A0A928UVR4_9SPHI|nr:polysaccharide biosynthesis/export family protein [Sphingobacterium hungaricum]MBE8714115.1 sugar transporter [Sphingobacterium hungaricum]